MQSDTGEGVAALIVAIFGVIIGLGLAKLYGALDKAEIGDFLGLVGAVVGTIGAFAAAYWIERHRDRKADKRIKRAIVSALLELQADIKLEDVNVDQMALQWSRICAAGVELRSLLMQVGDPTIEQYSYLRTISGWIDRLDFQFTVAGDQLNWDMKRNMIETTVEQHVAPLIERARAALPPPFLLTLADQRRLGLMA